MRSASRRRRPPTRLRPVRRPVATSGSSAPAELGCLGAVGRLAPARADDPNLRRPGLRGVAGRRQPPERAGRPLMTPGGFHSFERAGRSRRRSTCTSGSGGGGSPSAPAASRGSSSEAWPPTRACGCGRPWTSACRPGSSASSPDVAARDAVARLRTEHDVVLSLLHTAPSTSEPGRASSTRPRRSTVFSMRSVRSEACAAMVAAAVLLAGCGGGDEEAAWEQAPSLGQAALPTPSSRTGLTSGRSEAPTPPANRCSRSNGSRATAGRMWRILPGGGLNAPAAAFLDGRIYVIGGFGTTTNVPRTCHVYDVKPGAGPRRRRFQSPAAATPPPSSTARSTWSAAATRSRRSTCTPSTTRRRTLGRGRAAAAGEGQPGRGRARGKLWVIGGRSGPRLGEADATTPRRTRGHPVRRSRRAARTAPSSGWFDRRPRRRVAGARGALARCCGSRTERGRTQRRSRAAGLRARGCRGRAVLVVGGSAAAG